MPEFGSDERNQIQQMEDQKEITHHATREEIEAKRQVALAKLKTKDLNVNTTVGVRPHLPKSLFKHYNRLFSDLRLLWESKGK